MSLHDLFQNQTGMEWYTETLRTFCLSPIKIEEEEITIKMITALH